MINVRATKNYIDVIAREFLTSGSVNAYTVAFSFDSIWDGLDRTAVFQAGDSKISVILDDTNQCQIPWEVLENPRRTLEVGVYGTRNGTVVLPTVWVSLGEIKQGVSLGDNNQPPTPDVYGQILQAAKDAEDIAQGVRDDADSGKFDGEVGPIGPQGYTYTPAVSEEGVISWANDGGLPNPSPVNIKGPQGKQGIQGNQGKQGERGYVYTPNVSQDGIISWTNDGGLENPGPVDIRGPVGPQGGQGEQGIQGPRGYTYTPSVGEDGTVSWTNDGNLPNPDPVNITGPQGQPGETPDITVGTVETLDPDQDATANITGETPNLTLNLGIPKGQPGQEDVLELLETITVDDEKTTEIVRSGTYQLKAAVCTVYLPLTNGDSGNMTMYVSSGLGPIGYASIPRTNASTSAKRVKFRFYRKAGEYFSEGVVFPNAEEELGGITMYFREYATPKIVESLGPITNINIQKSNVARLPLGTEIKLYGVRA